MNVVPFSDMVVKSLTVTWGLGSHLLRLHPKPANWFKVWQFFPHEIVAAALYIQNERSTPLQQEITALSVTSAVLLLYLR